MSFPEYDMWAQDPTPENLAKIITELEPTINAEVQRFPGSKPLLRGRAKSLTVKAVQSYKPAEGTQLRSWVITQLQPLARYGQQLRPVHAAEVAIRQAAEVNRIRGELSDELDRDPTLVELADATGISSTRIKRIREQVKPTMSEGSFMEADNPEDVNSLPGTTLPNRMDTSEEIVYDSLDPRDKTIFDWKTGKHGKTQLANQEIAKRLGVTPAMITQRSYQIALQIRDLHNRGTL